MAVEQLEISVLEDLEPRIWAIARRFSSNPDEIEDFKQIGRIAVWQVLEKNPEANTPYILKAVENRFLDEKRKERTQKRGSGRKPLSIHKYEGEEFSIEESLGVDGDISELEKTEFIKSCLREKFGRTYLRFIKGNRKQLPGQIVRALVEEVWKLDETRIPEVDYQKFVESGMQSFLFAFYGNSPARAIQDAYPGKFFEWELGRVSNGFWQGEQGYKNAVNAVKWLCEKHKINGSERFVNIGLDEFEKTGFTRMLHLHFHDSIFLAIKSVFPSLKPWQMRQTMRGFYGNVENERQAVDSLLLELGFPLFSSLTPEEIYDANPRRLRTSHFMDAGLRGILARHHKAIYEIFDYTYPGKTYPWFFYGCYKRNGNIKELGKKAIAWLFDNYLEIPNQDIPRYASLDLFWRMGFSGLLTRRDLGLGSSVYEAIDLAYPGEFSREDFSRSRVIYQIPGLKDFRTREKGK
ncbi:sigma-70 family RNA polymerase sigma factor [Candidatus Pacearchaeota archaeon]|nr:sigma-70 family RNA polymerase sigma factor [Candidatus Pacearchaeota archaeon]